MKIHFIAIGGSVMHNLAMALRLKGDIISGSDDEIFEPARSNLKAYGILPEKEGWYPEKINAELDAVILGMHAKSDNPELIKAKELGLTIYSFPEFLYNHAIDKQRIVIGGSHGKTTITAMIMHVLKMNRIDFDYMVGAKLEGFDIMVRLSEPAPVMIFEGDEYLTSALDQRPKFHLYKPEIALLSGIDWDHMNVFPTKEFYNEQFVKFIELIEKNGTLIYCQDDEDVNRLVQDARPDINMIPYDLPEYEVVDNQTVVINKGIRYPLNIFGRHNMLNLIGAKKVCNVLGIGDGDFFKFMTGFKGAAKRLELLGESSNTSVYKDFAHAPSKLKATVNAVKDQYPDRMLIACMELHTYSSLNKDFLPQYSGSMDDADEAIIFFNPHAFKIKKLQLITTEDIKKGFNRKDLLIFDDSEKLTAYLLHKNWAGTNLLMMSSGDFGVMDLVALAEKVVEK